MTASEAPGGIRVQITVKGRVGPSLRSQFPSFEQRVVPRHHVLLVRSDLLADAIRAGAGPERLDVDVDRVTG